MAINLASKYSTLLDEKFTLGAKTTEAVNQNYDFLGVNSVKIWTVPTVAMGDYTKTGANRYGAATELQDTVQELTLSQDKAFAITIDKGNNDDQMMIKSAASVLARQIDEQVIPMIDKYRISQMAANAGTKTTAAAALTKDTAYEAFLDANIVLTDNMVPETGRICYVTPGYYKLLKLAPNFIQASDMAQDMLIRGQIGEVDGVRIMAPLPTTYFPSKQQFIITHPVAMTSPVKLTDYTIHENPPGISGALIEGRVRFDAFVLEQKKMAIVSVVNP